MLVSLGLLLRLWFPFLLLYPKCLGISYISFKFHFKYNWLPEAFSDIFQLDMTSSICEPLQQLIAFLFTQVKYLFYPLGMAYKLLRTGAASLSANALYIVGAQYIFLKYSPRSENSYNSKSFVSYMFGSSQDLTHIWTQ